MTENHYDMVIIGSGIHGAGLAQAAAAGGYYALVLEQGVLAGGISSHFSLFPDLSNKPRLRTVCGGKLTT